MNNFRIRPGGIYHLATTLGEPDTQGSDASISFEQFQKATGLGQEDFGNCDIDGDGYLKTQEEMALYWRCLLPE